MTAARDHLEIRLTSSRAPYTRAGIRFASNRTPVVLSGAEVSDDQLVRLSEDTAISIEIVDPATGDRIEMVKSPEGAPEGAPPAEDAIVRTVDSADAATTTDAVAPAAPAPAAAPVSAPAARAPKRTRKAVAAKPKASGG